MSQLTQAVGRSRRKESESVRLLKAIVRAADAPHYGDYAEWADRLFDPLEAARKYLGVLS